MRLSLRTAPFQGGPAWRLPRPRSRSRSTSPSTAPSLDVRPREGPRAHRALRRTPCAVSASSASNGAIVITPRTSIPDSPRRPLGFLHAHRRVDSRPSFPPRPRSPAPAPPPAGRALPDARASASASRRAVHRVDQVRTASICLTLFRCRCPMRCQRTGARRHVGIFGSASCTLFSPTSRSPASHAACTALGPVRLGHRDDRDRLTVPAARHRRVDPCRARRRAGPAGPEMA